MRAAGWGLVLVGIAACVTLSVSAWGQAQPRSVLTGFGAVHFGMTEAELRKSIAVFDETHQIPDGTWLTGKALVNVAGGRFALKILIDQGVVRRISLLDLAPVAVPDCQPGFDRMVGYVEDQYGRPDTKGKKVPQVVKESYTSKFKFADGAQIEVGTFLNGSGKECGNSIVFFNPQDAPREKPQAPSDT
jgi:hypothetical protein